MNGWTSGGKMSFRKGPQTLPERSTTEWSFSAEPHPQAEKPTQASDRERWRLGMGTARAPSSGIHVPSSPEHQTAGACLQAASVHPLRAVFSRHGLWIHSSSSSTRGQIRTVKSQPCPRPTDSDSEVGPSTLRLTNPPGDSTEASWRATVLEQGFSALVRIRRTWGTCLSSDPGASAQDSDLIDFGWGSDFRML